MRAALKHLAGFGGRKIAVLGTMGELGAGAARWHEDMGAHARKIGIDLIVAVGPHAGDYLAGAGRSGVAFPDAASAAAFLKNELREGDTVLVKASRSARFEQIAGALGFGAGCGEGARC
jgi:UDP-N-acetylmuramoyl-tripeptide--D-alanyl-D-alanine ligase